MIRQTIEPGTKVFHEVFGIGEFVGFEEDEGHFKGFAIVKFFEYPELSMIPRKRLTEIEE